MGEVLEFPVSGAAKGPRVEHFVPTPVHMGGGTEWGHLEEVVLLAVRGNFLDISTNVPLSRVLEFLDAARPLVLLRMGLKE